MKIELTDEPETDTETESDETAEPEFDLLSQVQADLETCHSEYDPLYELIDEEVGFFWDLDQYLHDTGNTRATDEIQPHDLTLNSLVRRKWSLICQTPPYFQCHPQSGGTDPDAASRTKWLIEREIFDRQRMYLRNKRRMVMGGLTARVWHMHCYWDPDARKQGEIVYLTVPADKLHVAPGWLDMHDLTCPYVIHEQDLTLGQLQRMARGTDGEPVPGWQDLEGVHPDADSPSMLRSGRPSLHPSRSNTASPSGNAVSNRFAGKVATAWHWYRFDPADELEQIDEGDEVDLEPGEEFMGCEKCGYSTATHPPDPETGQLPQTGGWCPDCAKRMPKDAPADDFPMLEKISRVQPFREQQRYPFGRLVVWAVNQHRILYDGPWPYEKPTGGTIRSFPFMSFRAYEDPRMYHGHSDVEWNWSMQVINNGLLRNAFEQIERNVDLLIAPQDGLVDSRRNPYRFTNQSGQVAYLKNPSMGASLKHFKGSGVTTGWSEVYQSMNASLVRNLGSGDLHMGPDQSKDVAVGTVKAMIQSGDIPVDDHLAVLRDEESIFLGVVADILQCCLDLPRMVRYFDEEGQAAFEEFSGADLCDVDVSITAEPTLQSIKSSEWELGEKFMNLMPHQRRTFAKLTGLDQSIVRDYAADEAKAYGGLPPIMGPEGTLVPDMAGLQRMAMEQQAQAGGIPPAAKSVNGQPSQPVGADPATQVG